jgi:hypothetical protein
MLFDLFQLSTKDINPKSHSFGNYRVTLYNCHGIYGHAEALNSTPYLVCRPICGWQSVQGIYRHKKSTNSECKESCGNFATVSPMGVWQGVAMDSLKYR